MSPVMNGFAVEDNLSKKKKKKHEKSKPEDVEKKKKRKAVEEEESSNTSSDVVETVPIKNVVVNGSLPKKARVVEEEEVVEDAGELAGSGEEDGGIVDVNALTNFRISKVLRERLNSKGIKALFQIQAMTFDMIFEGSDLVGRARTGQPPTLAASANPISRHHLRHSSFGHRRHRHLRPPPPSPPPATAAIATSGHRHHLHLRSPPPSPPPPLPTAAAAVNHDRHRHCCRSPRPSPLPSL